MPNKFDAIIIGTGQSGPSLAERFAKQGLRVAVIERKYFGGTCVNTGCVPTKTLVASAYVAHMARRAAEYGVDVGERIKVDMKRVKARKDAIVAKSRNGVTGWMEGLANTTVYRSHARFTGPKTVSVNGEVLEADNIVINTGGRALIPAMPGLDHVPYFTNSSMMEVDFLPQRLLIVGGSYVGLEFAQAYRRFGARVTVVEMADRLIAREDPDVSDAVREILESEGIEVRLNARCLEVEEEGDGIAMRLDCSAGAPSIRGSHLLLAVGRQPNTDDLGLDRAGVKTDAKGFITVDDQCRTNVPGIWAVGDVNGRGAFTHTSYNDFEIVVGGVGEGTTAIDVAHGPNPRDVSAALVVDGNEAFRIRFHPGPIETEIVRVWLPTDSEQEMAAPYARRTGAAIEAHGNAVALLFDLQAPGIEAHFNPLALENLPDGVRHIRVLAGDQPIGHLNHRHAGAEAAIGLRELEADVAAADDKETLGQEIDLHHRAVGEIGDVVEPRHGGNERAATRVDDDVVGLENLAVDAHRLRPGEACVAAIDCRIRQTLHPTRHAIARFRDDGILAGCDRLRVYFDPCADIDTIFRGAPRHVGHVRARDERFRRHAPSVDAGAPEVLALDDGNAQTLLRKALRQRRAGLTRTDDNGIELIGHDGGPPSGSPRGWRCGLRHGRRRQAASGSNLWVRPLGGIVTLTRLLRHTDASARVVVNDINDVTDPDFPAKEPLLGRCDNAAATAP